MGKLRAEHITAAKTPPQRFPAAATLRLPRQLEWSKENKTSEK